jgi:hypothetical protein
MIIDICRIPLSKTPSRKYDTIPMPNGRRSVFGWELTAVERSAG